jgi:hypothetical protein
LRYRLSGDARRGVQVSRGERLVSVEDPCHLPLASAVIRRRHINARPDEILFDQLVRVTPRQPLQLLFATVARIDSDRTLGATEGHIHDGAFDGHEGGQGLDFIFVGVRAIADAAFHRQFVMAMLDAPGLTPRHHHQGDTAEIQTCRRYCNA